jgi:hypothetical protein
VPEELTQLRRLEAHVDVADGTAVGGEDADRLGAGPMRGLVHSSSMVEDAESIGAKSKGKHPER